MNRRRTNHITALPRSDKRMDLHHLVHPASRHSSPAVTNSPLYPTSEPLRHDMDTPSQPPSHCQHNRTISDPTNFRILPRSSTPPPPRPPTPPRFRTQSNNRHEHYIHVGESHSAPIISSTPLPALPLPSFGVPTQGRGRQQPRRQRAESDSSSIITARRDFAVAITRPSPRRGYLQCKLCDREVWGPNGMFHIFVRRCS